MVHTSTTLAAFYDDQVPLMPSLEAKHRTTQRRQHARMRSASCNAATGQAQLGPLQRGAPVDQAYTHLTKRVTLKRHNVLTCARGKTHVEHSYIDTRLLLN